MELGYYDWAIFRWTASSAHRARRWTPRPSPAQFPCYRPLWWVLIILTPLDALFHDGTPLSATCPLTTRHSPSFLPNCQALVLVWLNHLFLYCWEVDADHTEFDKGRFFRNVRVAAKKSPAIFLSPELELRPSDPIVWVGLYVTFPYFWSSGTLHSEVMFSCPWSMSWHSPGWGCGEWHKVEQSVQILASGVQSDWLQNWFWNALHHETHCL